MDYSSVKNNFLYPRYPYYGDPKTENLRFNADLQNFAQTTNYICNLATAGKLTQEDAYQQIQCLWVAFRATHHSLETSMEDQPQQ